MAFNLPPMIIRVASGMMFVAVLFQIIGLAAPGWIVEDTVTPMGRAHTKRGLWEECYQTNRCIDIQDSPAWLDACRAFSILGALGMAVSLGCTVLVCFRTDEIIFFVAVGAALGGAFCAMIEFAVFSGVNSDKRHSMSYSFALTVTAFVLCLPAAFLLYLGRKRD